MQTYFKDEELIATQLSMDFGEKIKSIDFETKLKINVKESTPLYLHLHLMKSDVHPDPMISPFNPFSGIYKRFPLLRAMKRPAKKLNLLKDDAPLTSEKSDKDNLVWYWYPELHVNLVNTDENIELQSFLPFSRQFIYADRIHKQYYPIIYFNEFWELKNKRVPIIDDSLIDMPLKITFSTISMLMFRIMTQLDFAIRNQEQIYGEHNGFENIKKMLLETSPWLILITFIVSVVHSLFDFLAFKSGI